MASTPSQPLPPKQILVVEDDLVLAQTIRVTLALEGHKVEIAADAEQALTMFETGDYDLVITDFKLPKMDGLELAQVIKERAPSRPIILITAHAEAVFGMGNVSNVDNLLGKPFSSAELQGALVKVFQAPGA
jgi:DNA-binding response OmpR family regulator